MWLFCAAACQALLDIDVQVTAWKFRCSFSPCSVFPRQGTYWEANVSAGRICTSNLPSGTALQQDFEIRKVGWKHLMMNILAAVHFAWYFSFAVIMSEIHPTDHDSITARNFPEEGFSEADGEFCWVEKDYKLVEAKFSKVLSLIFSELNKQEDCVHTVCCLVPVNIERIQDHQAIHSTPLNFLQLPFRIRNLVLES